MKFFWVLLILGLAILYRQSFTSPFFQDDWHLLEISQGNILAAYPNFPYRPISIQIFYRFGNLISADNPLGFHITLFILFILSLIFLKKVANRILNNQTAAYWSVVFYAFNISLFPLFFWVATSYFVFTAFFVFGCLYFHLQKEKWSNLFSSLFFVGGLLSNELVLVLPLLVISLDFILKKINWRKFFSFTIIAVAYLTFRLQIASFPQAVDYRLNFSFQAFSTLRWYVLRVFNLPEGVRLGADWIIYVLFFSVVTLALLLLYKSVQKKFVTVNLAFFAAIWFLFGALPFFFLPGHMSSYYLTISLFGPAVLFGKTAQAFRRLSILFFILYLFLASISLSFLSRTHWIILKPQ